MKKKSIVSFGALIISLCCALPTQADEQINTINAAQLQAAIEAFGVPTEQAKNATIESASIVENEKKKSDKNYQDMLIVSDDFFTLSPF